MYENVTYEDILKRMLDKIPSNMDKREGSVIYDALAPAAIELQNMYLELDVILNETFADTASLTFLEKRAAERGIHRTPATNAILKATVTPSTVEIEIGSRLSLNDLNYQVTEKISNGEYKVQCEESGTVGNYYFGNMIPIDYIHGLQVMEVTELLIPGEDAEDVEALRERYFESLTSQAYGGNIEDYRVKVRDIPGVGGVKVTPVWNGGGTVKVTITDSTYSVPSDELVTLVQTVIDPVDHSGEGYGVAPIGHVVTVEGAEGVTVNIVTSITYAPGWSWNAAASYIKKTLDDYFSELSKMWDETNETNLIVRISQIESKILQVDGVVDISGTTLNGSDANLYLTKNQIPVRGSVNGNE